jgi:Ulp1 family protease
MEERRIALELGANGADRVLIPMCAGLHWALLSVERVEAAWSMVLYDSLATGREPEAVLQQWTEELAMAMELFGMQQCDSTPQVAEVPNQKKDSNDCGIYVLM